MKRKANILVELLVSIVINGIDLGHDRDLEFSRSNKVMDAESALNPIGKEQ